MCLLYLAHFLGVPSDLSGMNFADHPEPEQNYLSKFMVVALTKISCTL